MLGCFLKGMLGVGLQPAVVKLGGKKVLLMEILTVSSQCCF